MHVDHLHELVQTAKSLRTEIGSLTWLNYDLGEKIEAFLERAEALLPAPASAKLDLNSYRAPVIVEAVLALGDRRPALVRTWLNARLEERHGRRNGGIGGAPHVGNGHSAGNGAHADL